MSAASTTVDKPKKGFPGLASLQRIGRSLMLPIASLPAAALLMRLGQPDMLGSDGVASWSGMAWMQPVADVLAAAGNALFSNLALIFAVGIAIGFARKSDGSTGLAAVIGYVVFIAVLAALAPHFGGLPAGADTTGLDAAGIDALRTIDYGVLGGIVIGITTALLYQKFYRVKLVPWLAFFGGRRFVPIITAFTAMLIAVVFALIYPWFNTGFTNVGNWVTGSGALGAFVFGTVNRLLLPFGLHHLLNSFPWFQFGSYTDAAGATWHGDIARFLHGDPTAGMFMTGFFPIMMFALPAAALAMWHTAKSTRAKVIGGIMVSAALTAFVTGVTEPIEFSFVYVAYPLYAIHAVLTGTSMALTQALGIHDGFGFSAGAIDFLLNFGIAQKPLLLIVIGLGYGVVYYVLFRWVIKKFNLKTPGREEEGEDGKAVSVLDDAYEEAETGKKVGLKEGDTQPKAT